MARKRKGANVEAQTAEAAQAGLRIVVYAIAKNESKFAARWMDSMREADEVVVLDTGSTDGTPELLRGLGARVEVKTFAPWRFDVARNASMEMVQDADVLVCTDLDEYFTPGWRAKLETAWLAALARGEKPTTARYHYVWNFNADGTDGCAFTYEKIHAPGVARWTHPVHEILAYPDGKRFVDADLRLEHHADPHKSRAQYLALLKLSCEEDPDDDRNAHYYGRELMFWQKWDDAIFQLKRHLSLPRATWSAERAASMRFIARCMWEGKRDYNAAVEWYWKAIAEAPLQREAAVELAWMAYKGQREEDWPVVRAACEAAVRVTERSGSYLTKPEAWGPLPWDLLSLAAWKSGDMERAVAAAEEALRLAPEDGRIKGNLEYFKAKLGGGEK